MGKWLFLLLAVMMLLGCTSKPKVDLSKYPYALDDIGNYADSHINEGWFQDLGPTRQIRIIGMAIQKIDVLDAEERSADMTVLMKGYYIPAESKSDDDKKLFKLTKTFELIPLYHDEKSHYNVAMTD